MMFCTLTHLQHGSKTKQRDWLRSVFKNHATVSAAPITVAYKRIGLGRADNFSQGSNTVESR